MNLPALRLGDVYMKHLDRVFLSGYLTAKTTAITSPTVNFAEYFTLDTMYFKTL